MPHAGGPPLFVITMQLTLAAMLFTRLLERRDHFIVRLVVAIVAFNSLDLIWGLGSFHCMSQQEPAL